jgi:hypothetical protein
MTLRQKVSGTTTAGDGLGVGDPMIEESAEDEAVDGSIEAEDDGVVSTEEEGAAEDSEVDVTELLATSLKLLDKADDADVEEAKSEAMVGELAAEVENASVDRAADELEEKSKLVEDTLEDAALLDTSSVELDDGVGANALGEETSKEEGIEEEALDDAGSDDTALELAMAEDVVLDEDAVLDTVVVLGVAASEEDEETTLQSPKPFWHDLIPQYPSVDPHCATVSKLRHREAPRTI